MSCARGSTRRSCAPEIRASQEAHAQRLAEIFRQAPVAIAILRGPDHTYEFANEPYLGLVAHRPILGKPILEALPELADQGIKELLDEVRSSGKPFASSSRRVLLNRGADGAAEEAFFKLVYQPMIDGDGQSSGIVVVATDVTELANARRDAESANRAKDEFIAMLSHELRNPLSPILTALQLMKLRGIDAAERERTIIERQVGHLVGLVDDLLDVSRITRGKIDLKKETWSWPTSSPTRSKPPAPCSRSASTISTFACPGAGARFTATRSASRRLWRIS